MALRPSSARIEVRHDGTAADLISDTPEKTRAARSMPWSSHSRQPERSRHPPRRTVPVARKAGRARSREVPTAHGAGCRHLTARRAGVMLVTLAPEQVPDGFIAQLARPASGSRSGTRGNLRADQGRAGAGPHRVHAPLQRHAAAGKPRAWSDRRGLETPDVWFGMIVDGHHVDPGPAPPGASGALRVRCSSPMRCRPSEGAVPLHALRPGNQRSRGPLHEGGRFARRRSSRHGVGRAQLR